ncbi:phosphoserine phosphatase [Jatrophihabitans endophyticus]|uniref:phosphoserine phosphatase n=1 Tax=Jatrophihabitans endophyticus TaxID=1206085 RepID=A0A1M5PGQ2_9ACTN|nr:phosphoserine phosphatase SerB [Jatrophihabitans endophyticus]SHH00928.1 phosphoserine phosphatase [Jatrophihabitans endophyticus]
MQPTSVLATLTGRDRPGVTASFFAALAAHDVDVKDVEQVVIRERLVLAVLFDLRGDPAALRNSVTKTAHALGMECEVAVADDPAPRRPARSSRSHVIVLGRPLRPGALSHVAGYIAEAGANIESMTQLSTEPASSVEMIVGAADPTRLRAALVRAADDTGLDIAVEPAGLRRRAKRLVVLDVDSTLIQDEAIDVLAERAGVGGEVAAITERAMAGQLDFAESLRARVALLAGLTVADLDVVRDGLRLTPGARTFVRTLRRLGFHVGVVSGGFTFVTDRFVAELELDFAAANQLEIVDGVVTGRLVGDIVDRPGKAAALARFAERYGVPSSQTVAVGDGANDIDMLEAAGLGVAFNAKTALRRAADTSVNLPYLDTILFVLGISDSDVAEAAADDPAADDPADAATG